MTDWDDLLLKDRKFTFAVSGMDIDTFAVLEFKGAEGISRLFEYDIKLLSDDPEIDYGKIINMQATFTIVAGETKLPVYGDVALFEQLHQVEGKTVYRAVLVPCISALAHERKSEIYLEKSFPEVLEEVMHSSGFVVGTDYTIELQTDYPKWTHMCQYQETDLDFISRWMEHYGIYYYFDHSSGRDKMVITDSRFTHKPPKGKMSYAPPTGKEVDVTRQVLHSIVVTGKAVPAKVTLTDYNYRHSAQPISGSAKVSDNGKGTVTVRGEHVKTEKQAGDLAEIRAEEILSRETVTHCEGTVVPVQAGFLCEIDEHYRKSVNRKYLAVSVEREGSQTGFILTGLGVTQSDRDLIYRVTFACIPDDRQFRPERKTPKPRITGTMNAFVDAEGSGKYAELDEFGRYKVKLPFGSDKNPGKASRWTRLSTPYAGDKHGMHFPLLKGSEVLLTFVDGDPDRPIIQGAIPNSTHDSVVNSKNATINSLVTAGGNAIRINDKEDGQSIHLVSPSSNTFLRLGATMSAAGSTANDKHDSGAGDKKDDHGGGHADPKLTEKEQEWIDEQIKEQKEEKEAAEKAMKGWTCNVTPAAGFHLKTEAGVYVCCAGEYQEHVRGNETKWIDGKVTETIKGGEDKTVSGLITERSDGVEFKTHRGLAVDMIWGEEIKTVVSAGVVADACGGFGKFGFIAPLVVELVVGGEFKFKNFKLENAEAEIKHIDTKLEAVEAKLSTVATKQELAAVKTTINGKLTSIQGELDEFMADANRVVGAMHETVGVHGQTLAAHTAQMGAMQQTVGAAQQSIAALQRDSAVQQDQIGALIIESALTTIE